MSFEAYIRSHYVDACELQRNIPEDEEMKSMLARGDQDKDLVKKWMRNYALFQGITTRDREKIAKRFLSFSASAKTIPTVADRTILEERYSRLFTELFSEVKRTWMSATSKLLWCIYPDEVVIYDSFVERALVVMQCLEGSLATFPRIGARPRIKRKADIGAAVKHYMNYQDVVRHILKQYSGALKELREKHKETYPHDIRIVDKLLWMIGNPKYDSSDLRGGQPNHALQPTPLSRRG